VVRENWFIATLVTHTSGVSRGIHHKCKHPLNPTKLYVSRWVESSLNVLIWGVVTWLDDVCIIDCGSISVCMIKPLLALAYPSVIVVCFTVWYSLLWWSSTCWCEQMRGTPVLNREVMVPLLSFWIDFCFWAFHLGLRPMYYFLWEFAYVIITLLLYFVLGIVVCLFYSSLSHWDICRSDIILFYSRFLCYTVWHILYLALLNKWDVTKKPWP